MPDERSIDPTRFRLQYGQALDWKKEKIGFHKDYVYDLRFLNFKFRIVQNINKLQQKINSLESWGVVWGVGQGFNLFDDLLVKILYIMLVNNSMLNFYR